MKDISLQRLSVHDWKNENDGELDVMRSGVLVSCYIKAGGGSCDEGTTRWEKRF